jgi:beta-lactamase class A
MMKTWLLILMMSLTASSAAEVKTIPNDARVQSVVDDVVAAALQKFASKKLQSNQLAVTLIDLRNGAVKGSFRGEEKIYPASVIKLFYLAAAHQWMEDGKLKDTEELRRALRDMIVDSSNDATHYVLDSITGTTGGPELSDEEMKVWGEKRNAVNRYFASLGYTNINANQKPWGDGPYGRERIWVGKSFGNRNALTTDATARLLAEMGLHQCISSNRSEQMLELLKRDPADKKDDQARFSFSMLPSGAKLFSKAGWTSTARHDAAYVAHPDGRKFVLVVFTSQHANDRDIIPFIAQRMMEKL